MTLVQSMRGLCTARKHQKCEFLPFRALEQGRNHGTSFGIPREKELVVFKPAGRLSMPALVKASKVAIGIPDLNRTCQESGAVQLGLGWVVCGYLHFSALKPPPWTRIYITPFQGPRASISFSISVSLDFAFLGQYSIPKILPSLHAPSIPNDLYTLYIQILPRIPYSLTTTLRFVLTF